MSKAVIYFILALHVLTSCHHTQTRLPLLDRAEAFMLAQPDSALLVLQEVDATALSEGALQARYALLYTQALEKNDLPIPGDSLINLAVRYYEKSDNARYKTLAYLYQGVAYQHIDSIAWAFSSLMQAVEAAASLQDAYIYGLTQSYLAILYQGQKQYENAIALYKKSLTAYKQAGHQQNENYALGQLGDLFYLSGRIDSANSYYLLAGEMAVARCDTSYMYLMDCARAILLLSQGAYAQSKSLLFETVHKYKSGIIPEDCYSNFAFSYLGLGQLDSARHYVLLALQNPELTNTEYIWNLSLLKEIARQGGDWEEAFMQQQQYSRTKDSILNVRSKQNIQAIEADYHKEKAELERDVLWYRSRMLTAFFTLVMALLVSLFFLMRKRWKKAIDTLGKKHLHLRQTIDKNAPHKHWDTTKFLNQCRPILLEADEQVFCTKVLHVAHIYYRGLIPWLNMRYPTLTESDICLACLLFSNMKPAELGIIYYKVPTKNSRAIYVRCSRLYKKMDMPLTGGRSSQFKKVLMNLYQQDMAVQ